MENIKEKVKDLTLMLLYLTSWEEKKFDTRHHRSWKGHDFGILNEFTDEGLIYGDQRSKSIYLDESGIGRARALLRKYGIEE